MTPAGIEPATFRFVAQHRNYCATAVPEIVGVCKLSVVVVPLCGTIIRLCRGAVSNILAAGSEQVTLQATGRCSDSYWKNCGSACVAIYRTELCLGAVSECISAGSDTDNNQRSASVVILVPAVNLMTQHYRLHHQQL